MSGRISNLGPEMHVERDDNLQASSESRTSQSTGAKQWELITYVRLGDLKHQACNEEFFHLGFQCLVLLAKRAINDLIRGPHLPN